MRNKRLLSLLLTAATTASLFSGACCNAEEAPELDEKTIQIWLIGSKQQDSEKVWDKFNEMLQEYVPNTTVEFTIFPESEYNEKFQQMLASGEGVDVAWAANWVTGNINDAIRDGNFMVLDDLIVEYGQGIVDTLSQEVVDFHRKGDGSLYYLVNWQGLLDSKHGFYALTEIADLAGETWVEDMKAALDKYWNEHGTPEDMQVVYDQIVKYFEAAEAADKLGVAGGIMAFYYGTGLSSAVPAAYQIGVLNGDETFTVVDAIQEEYYRTYAKNMADLYNRGYFWNVASSDKGVASPKDGVIAENTAILDFHNIWGSSTDEKLTKQYGMDVTCISVEDNATLQKGESTINVIPYCADEPERAMMVMNAIYTVPELYQTLVWGIEGEHWTDNGDGTVNYTGGGYGSSAAYGYQNWKIGSCINGLTTQTDVPGYYEELKELESTAYISTFNNFEFDTTGYEDIVSAVNAVANEYESQISQGYHGDNWEEVLNKYIAERKAAGVDELVAAYQEQLNAYIEENGITTFYK